MSEFEAIRLAALDVTSNGVVITDAQGRICWVNRALTEMTGWTPEELSGKNPRILRSGHTDPAVYADLWDTISRGDVWSGRLINRRKDGTRYHEEMTINPIATDGVVTHFVAVKRDVTALVRAERIRAKLQTQAGLAAEALSDSVHEALSGFADLADLSDPVVGLHQRRVGELACRMAVCLDLNLEQIKDIRLAGLTHDLGKLSRRGSTDRVEPRHEHAVRSALLLASVSGTERIRTAVRHHHENFDGSGGPDGLRGLQIPLESRIIAVASAYDHLRRLSRSTPEQAVQTLEKRAHERYDPRMVALVAKVASDGDGASDHEGSLQNTDDLQEGMRLVEPLTGLSGTVLYPAGVILSDEMIRRIHAYSDRAPIPSVVRVVDTRPAGQAQAV